MLDDVATTLVIVIEEEEQRMQQTHSSSSSLPPIITMTTHTPDEDEDDLPPVLPGDEEMEVIPRPPTPVRIPSPSTRQRIHKSAVIEECIIQIQDCDDDWVMGGLG